MKFYIPVNLPAVAGPFFERAALRGCRLPKRPVQKVGYIRFGAFPGMQNQSPQKTKAPCGALAFLIHPEGDELLPVTNC
jgi:hypothetical protein